MGAASMDAASKSMMNSQLHFMSVDNVSSPGHASNDWQQELTEFGIFYHNPTWEECLPEVV